MKAVYRTDRGRIRQNNEDSVGTFLNRDGHRLAIVADGMGGHRAGDVASNMTLTYLQEMWEKSEGIQTADQAEAWLRTHILQVNKLLFEHANNNLECDGMGTTIEAVIATQLFSTLAHIGDSRCYILNDTGFQQLTEDHTLVNELVRTGQISKEDAEHHPRKNVILRALGTEPDVKIDIKTIMFEEGDFLLLCSDGLSNKVNEAFMTTILQNEDSLEQKALTLINMANENGGEDNITLIILEFDDDIERG
ncbi:Stp1/IreP family PP2C-type Ser/Thr phosphatase [Neobacillus novalis]|uniref:protein-serine/threonine phosphatase n=1 Tax=Neobacillus novalis TaxID=220687 RepID=A0AA95MXI6_9BACI|nr:Stp1/IreP family PP2C-type Ser/Thr phosphatase [Neobacillus novalis]WHY88038.1 Stp1/IreP family PP2C-type Ser/Thr phosphatase [Neobacillus novalis]